MEDWITWIDEPRTLHSGGKSHWFVDADIIFVDHHLRNAVLDRWEQFIQAFQRPYHFWAVPSGGSKWAGAIAERVGGEWANLSSGYVHDGATVFTVDDVLTTGESLAGTPGKLKLVVVDRCQREVYVPEVVAWASIYLPLLNDGAPR